MKSAKYFFLCAWISTLGTSAVADDSEPVQGNEVSCACDPGCGPWYGFSEAIFWQRNNRSCSRPVVINTSLVPDEDTVLTTHDLHFQYDPGLRVLLGYQLNPCLALEFGYFGIFNSEAAATAEGNNNLAIPGTMGLFSNDFYNADIMHLTYRSSLNNLELNLVRPFCCCVGCCGWPVHRVDVFGGLRFLSLTEEFNIQSTDFGEGTSDYHIRTTNDLYGVQIGVRLKSNGAGRLGWELTTKGGIFGNAASQSQFATDFPPPFLLRAPVSSDGGRVALLGELGFSLTYQLSDVWSLRAGYNVLMLDGVALAPDQLDFTFTSISGAGLRDSGSVVYHGANVGIEACW